MLSLECETIDLGRYSQRCRAYGSPFAIYERIQLRYREIMSELLRTVHLRITGIVQGVCFRAWTVEAAESRGLAGWVRNRRDGSVEALFHGPADAVAAMIADCRRGPPHAKVDAVEVIAEGGEAPDGFEIRPTV
jgi:acylphosphatase